MIPIGAKHMSYKEEEKARSDTQLLGCAARKLHLRYCPQVKELGSGQERAAVMNGSK